MVPAEGRAEAGVGNAVAAISSPLRPSAMLSSPIVSAISAPRRVSLPGAISRPSALLLPCGGLLACVLRLLPRLLGTLHLALLRVLLLNVPSPLLLLRPLLLNVLCPLLLRPIFGGTAGALLLPTVLAFRRGLFFVLLPVRRARKGNRREKQQRGSGSYRANESHRNQPPLRLRLSLNADCQSAWNR